MFYKLSDDMYGICTFCVLVRSHLCTCMRACTRVGTRVESDDDANRNMTHACEVMRVTIFHTRYDAGRCMNVVKQSADHYTECNSVNNRPIFPYNPSPRCDAKEKKRLKQALTRAKCESKETCQGAEERQSGCQK